MKTVLDIEIIIFDIVLPLLIFGCLLVVVIPTESGQDLRWGTLNLSSWGHFQDQSQQPTWSKKWNQMAKKTLLCCDIAQKDL
jgi:hypothetical protein